ncbi:unnamed protein product [Hermetia illucens]|uniref:Nuclear envelope integral membrane protein 1 n=1 Tax=Hermetia illucens TaxID=343691 RepID=A0A7R8UZB5_HERIL|nr:nuclear envelope integral membrane protein 1 [Hermetia illucens]CAD7089920.1 unnamed protein product [Hermetia illucens]
MRSDDSSFVMERFLLLFLALFPFVSCSGNANLNVIYLEPGDSYPYQPEARRIGFFTADLRIYCYKGCDKSLAHVFQTIQLKIEIENDDYMQYEGSTPAMVQEHYSAQKSIFSFNLLSTKKTRIKLNPFNQTCIGIETAQPYRLRLQLIRIDFWRVIQISLGVLTFWYAAKLSRNSLFYYLSGIFLGIFASLLVLIYLASKLIPRKPMMYGVLIGGWTVAIYFGQMLWENLQMILVTYKSYVFWYILVTGFTSFVVCYRLGPPKNKRSRDLIKWGLQLASLVMIFYSSDYQEASAAINILVVLSYYFPRSWLYSVKSMYVRRFPPKPRLLSSEEYYEQGVKETTKALEDLRKYCNSPDCKQWKVVTSLKDPVRFASFMEGSSHLMDEEILDYETSRVDQSDSELSEDENEDQDDGENENDGEISEDEEAGGTASSRTVEDYNDSKKFYSSQHNGSIGRRSTGFHRPLSYSTPSPSSSSRSRASTAFYSRQNREFSDED